jgi:DNA topoisomerase-1
VLPLCCSVALLLLLLLLLLSSRSLASKLSKKMTQLQKAELAAAVKEDLKTVALGTSKINYMDPRITIAWCKRNEVRGG